MDTGDPTVKSTRQKLLLRMKFKYCVRRVIANIFWLEDEGRVVRRKSEAMDKRPYLNFETRVSLCQKPEGRSSTDIDNIVNLLMQIKDFRRFSFNFTKLARHVEYQTVQSQRIIIREKHIADALYVILSGDVVVTATSNDTQRVRSTLHAGTMFGDFALIYDQPRSVSITAITNVELLVITKAIFNRFIRETLRSHYYLINKALLKFQYFSSFDHRDIAEISFYGRVQQYKKGEVIYSSRTNEDMTCFILDGTCDIMEVLRVTRKVDVKGKDHFSHCRSESYGRSTVSEDQPTGLVGAPIQRSSSVKTKFYHRATVNEDNWQLSQLGANQKRVSSPESFIGMFQDANRFSQRKSMSVYRGSMVSNSEKKTSYELYKMRRSYVRNSVTNVEPHYMNIGTFFEASCFNIGENLDSRCIVANVNMKVLEIPRKVLLRQQSIVWEEVKRMLNYYVPTSQQVFTKFLKDRAYREWKRKLLSEIVTPQILRKSGNHLSNVPYSIRIRNDFDLTDYYHKMRFSTY
ncbi:uncharacterized protein [Atheta coriaria]|uniref:uncharacterized protein n=1 Tax=Dalotia coriaria TaxID=877792 RepID=UPI0031F34B95